MSKDLETLNISVKSILSFSAILFLLIGEYIVLNKEIEEAKRLPIPTVTTEAYKYDKKYLEKEIAELKEEVEKLSKRLKK
jgi:hypothetical protein|tara:strand:- start:337 stop:576 length:240 start_codon:yes stop_codon:yes gene_type:complete